MRKFTDRDGGVWQIDLTIGEVMRIKSESEGRFDLLATNADLDLDGDLVLFWELLQLICEPEATSRGINAREFGRLTTPECLIAAQAAFFSEWHDFFLSLQRPNLALAIEKMSLYRAKAIELAMARLLLETSDLDQRVEAKLQSTLNSSFGSLQARLDSILADSPGDSSPVSTKAGKRTRAR